MVLSQLCWIKKTKLCVWSVHRVVVYVSFKVKWLLCHGRVHSKPQGSYMMSSVFILSMKKIHGQTVINRKKRSTSVMYLSTVNVIVIASLSYKTQEKLCFLIDLVMNNWFVYKRDWSREVTSQFPGTQEDLTLRLTSNQCHQSSVTRHCICWWGSCWSPMGSWNCLRTLECYSWVL